MDFGRPMIRTLGIVAKSGIRLVNETHLGADPLDIRVCRAANKAAKDLFLGNEIPSVPTSKREAEATTGDLGDNDSADSNNDEGTSKNLESGAFTSAAVVATVPVRAPNTNDVTVDDSIRQKLPLVDCSLYNEHHLPPARRLICPGDLVVVFESFNDLNFVYATPKAIFSNRNGHFPHDDFIGKPYGCKIRSRDNSGLGFCYLLRPTPELWTRSLPHRTQIVHELDASLIVHYLDLCPNMVVCESGTGSGAMSHVILRSIAPRGKLHTYEFNRMRAEKAREEFEGHGLGHLVEVHQRDVCGKRTLLERGRNGKGREKSIEKKLVDLTHSEEIASYKGKDANVRNDNSNNSNKGNNGDDGRGGFQLGWAAAHAIFLDLPEPWLAVPHVAFTIRPNGRICSYSPCVEQMQRTVAALQQHGFHSLRTVEARLKEYFVDEVLMEAPPVDLPNILTEDAASLERERCANGGVLLTKTKKKDEEDMEMEARKNADESKGDASLEPREAMVKKRKGGKILCARPFSQMRGHSAFLTFATAPQPDRYGKEYTS